MLFVLAIKTYYYQNHWQRHGLARKNQKLCFFKLFFLKQLTHGTDRFLVFFFFPYLVPPKQDRENNKA